MKKRFMSLALATMMVFSLLSTTAFALNMTETGSNHISENPVDVIDLSTLDNPLMNVDSSELGYSPIAIDISKGFNVLADLTDMPAAMSADAITREYTGYLSYEDDLQGVEFILSPGEIFHATLTCPNNAYLDYCLVLCKKEDDESLTAITGCNLGTYIDPQTNKTVDEGLSFIHNQASEQTYVILVGSTSGSSTTDEFRLKFSIDAAGSFDRNEPNDNPFTATSIRMTTVTPASGSASGSLNAVTDQDWYSVTIPDYGVFKLSAGNYKVEPYYVTTGNKMVLAPKAGGNYILADGTYYIKVSAMEGEDFVYGDYTLSIADQSKYSTMYTAFDFGDWKSTYRPQPDPIPVGQYEAYFKFNIDTYEMVYAYISLYGDYGEQALEVLSSSGETLDVAYTEATGGVITSPIWGNRLIVDADGTQGNTIYLHVIRGNPLDSSAYMVPGINSRLQSNYGTFSFTGTANNSGNSLSTSISATLQIIAEFHRLQLLTAFQPQGVCLLV